MPGQNQDENIDVPGDRKVEEGRKLNQHNHDLEREA